MEIVYFGLGALFSLVSAALIAKAFHKSLSKNGNRYATLIGILTFFVTAAILIALIINIINNNTRLER